MDHDDDNDNKDRVLQIIPSKELRLIPLGVIISHIYDKIIEATFDCVFTYAFNIEQLLHKYELNTKLATPGNKMFIINEIKRLFPGIKITEIGEKYSARSQYNSYWSASWEEELDDIKATLRCPARKIITDVLKAEERIQTSRQIYKKLYN